MSSQEYETDREREREREREKRERENEKQKENTMRGKGKQTKGITQRKGKENKRNEFGGSNCVCRFPKKSYFI